MHLDREEFLQLVRHAPLVAIDLVVRDRLGRVLLGWRVNRPARDTWFVPGGRVYKGERLDAAFRRITAAELGRAWERAAATFLGVFEHLYDDNGLDHPGVGTHYVVLAHGLHVDDDLFLPNTQHGAWCWMTPSELVANPTVHPNTRAYFEVSSW
jgi:colanic acid biosynthesis protein WcaH